MKKKLRRRLREIDRKFGKPIGTAEACVGELSKLKKNSIISSKQNKE